LLDMALRSKLELTGEITYTIRLRTRIGFFFSSLMIL